MKTVPYLLAGLAAYYLLLRHLREKEREEQRLAQEAALKAFEYIDGSSYLPGYILPQ